MAGYLPTLSDNSKNKNREMIGQFGGYNHNLRIPNNDFWDMENMSSDAYPLITPREPRGIVRTFTKPNGLFAHERLCWIDGTDFYYDGEIRGTVEDSPKQLVGMGAYILIWPDKKYFNTSTGEFGSLANSVTTSGTVSITLTRLDGTAYTDYTVSDTAPANPEDGDLWIDTSESPHVLKQFSTSYGMWSSIPTTYVKIAAAGIGEGFAEYDGVTISGMENEALNGEFILYGAADDYIIVTAIIDAVATQSGAVVVERKIPDMDYVTESNNRVWGCSSANHEIYACVLGDPKNWYRYLGVATDSYAVTVGTPGDFTGCITHLGYVLFFKEDVIHKIYGNKPSNYQLTDTISRGVEKGSEKSLVIVNETLYYKSRQDVCAFNSALPASISEQLGEVQYHDAVAGARGSKYFISMRDEKNVPAMFVYDESRGLWHKEDKVYASYFAALGSELYFINADDNCLYSVGGTLEPYADNTAGIENQIRWYVQTGDIGLDSPDNKYISKLQVRLDVNAKSLVRIELQYDQDYDNWEEKYRTSINNRRSFTVPIIPRRCDTMRMRISGYGDCVIYSIAKTIEQGSEM